MKNGKENTKTYCIHCGSEIPQGNRFCENCGKQVKTGSSTEQEPQAVPKKKMIAAIAAVIVVVAGCIGGYAAFHAKDAHAQYTQKLESAQQYIDMDQISDAENVYLDLIEVEPKREEAYLALADLYVSEKEYNKADKVLDQSPGVDENKEIQRKKETITLHKSYDKHLNRSELATVDERYHRSEDKGGLISSQQVNIGDKTRWVEVSINDKKRVLTIALYGLEDNKVKQLDKKTVDMDFIKCGARNDLFLTKNDEGLFLCLGYNQCSDAESIYSGMSVYEIRESEIKEKTSFMFVSAYESSGTIINDKVVKEYRSESVENYDEDAYYAAIEDGSLLAEKELESIGIERDIKVGRENWNDPAGLYYEEGDSSETHVCRVDFGIFDEDNKWYDVAEGDMTYLVDYTDLREKTSEEQTEKKSNDPMDHYKKINAVGQTYKSIKKEYDLPEDFINVTDAWMVFESEDHDFQFAFIAGKLTDPEGFSYEMTDKDQCNRMTGSAGRMLGIENDMSVKEFEKRTGLVLEYGSGWDLETGAYRGLEARIHLEGVDEETHILFRDLSDEDDVISPDTMVDVERQLGE